LRGHQGSVRAVRYSPDGNWLASGGQDRLVLLWSTSGGRLARRFAGHRDWVNALAFTPDSRVLISGSGRSEGKAVDRRILLWDVAAGRQVGQLPGHDDAVRALAVQANGQLLASGGADRVIKLWGLSGRDSGRLLRVLRGHTERVFDVAFSPDGRSLASAGRDHVVRVWDPATGATRLVLAGHGESVRGVAFADNRTLLSVGNDSRVFVWDVARQPPPRLAAFPPGQPAKVHAVAVTPDGSTVATGSPDERVVVRDAGTGVPRGPVLRLGGPPSGLAFDPTGRTLLSITDDGVLDSWDVARGTRRVPSVSTGDYFPVIAVSPDGRRIATGGHRSDLPGERGVVRLWDEQLDPIGQLPGASSWVRGLAFRDADGALAATGADGVAWVWTGDPDRPVGHPVNQPANTMTTLAFAPDGHTLATGDVDGNVVLWDPDQRDVKATSRPVLSAHDGKPVTAVTYSRRGGLLVTADQSGSVVLWDGGQGAPEFVGRLGPVSEAYTAVALPAGTAVLAGTGTGPVLWDTDLASWRRTACTVAGRNLQPVELSRYLHDSRYHKTCPDLPRFDRIPGQVIDGD
jgi:WD40 repeat protein